MAKAKTWAEQRATDIEKELRTAWGLGWERLGSELQGALVAEKVLMLILSQFGEQHQATADMARDVLRASTHRIFGPDEVTA